MNAQFVGGIYTTDYPASIEQFKIYQVLPDDEEVVDGDISVIDESGEDYLYRFDYFVPMEVPQAVEQALMRMT